jgi:beta-glucosidase
MTGMGDWAIAFNHARKMVSNMTLKEKVSLTSGVGSDNGCIGSIPAVERLGFPGLCMGDAGQGLRATDFVSSFPSGIHAGARYAKQCLIQSLSC